MIPIAIPDVRIKYNGVRLRLRGFGLKKFHHLKILEAGLASIKERLARGIGEDDQPTEPLTKRYAIYKSKVTGRRAIRDMKLTGKTLAGLKPRYADDNQAVADASGRRGKALARIARKLLSFSPNDQKVMKEVAAHLFREQVGQTFESVGPARGGGFSGTRAANRQAVFNRAAYFARAS